MLLLYCIKGRSRPNRPSQNYWVENNYIYTHKKHIYQAKINEKLWKSPDDIVHENLKVTPYKQIKQKGKHTQIYHKYTEIYLQSTDAKEGPDLVWLV